MVRPWSSTPESTIELELVSFDSTSQGNLAIVIYEWKDYKYLGKVTSNTEELLPVGIRVTHIFATRS